MKINLMIFPALAAFVFFPLTVNAMPSQAQLERAVFKAVSDAQSTKYYVPLIQIEEEAAPGKDSPEAGIFWVEIGGSYTADGYEPEFFYLTANQADPNTNDGPSAPAYERIVPAVFNEAYKRFAASPRSAKATISETRQLLTTYYRQVQTEQKNTPAN